MTSPEGIGTVASIGVALVKILTPIIVTLMGLATTHLSAWIKSKTRNNTVEGAMRVLMELATAVVQDLEQTTVKALRDSNGSLDAETAKVMKALAIQRIQALYGPDGLRDLSKRLGATQDATLRLIGTFIEQAVFLMKSQSPQPSPVPANPPFDPNVFGGMTVEEKIAQQLKEQSEKKAAEAAAPPPPGAP